MVSPRAVLRTVGASSLFPRGRELILQSAEAASDELLGIYAGRRSEDADALLGNYVGQRAQAATNADELLENNVKSRIARRRSLPGTSGSMSRMSFWWSSLWSVGDGGGVEEGDKPAYDIRVGSGTVGNLFQKKDGRETSMEVREVTFVMENAARKVEGP